MSVAIDRIHASFERPQVSDESMAEIIGRLSREFHPCRIYLFGSHVYGVPHRDSDIDVMVVVDQVPSSFIDLHQRGYASLRDIHLPVELHFCDAHRFDSWATVVGSLQREIKDRGRLVHAA